MTEFISGLLLKTTTEFFTILSRTIPSAYIYGTCSASIFDNWIWNNTNYDIYENNREANTTYAYNYYAPFCPLYEIDKDGLSDGEEFTLHTSPVNIDTDNDNSLDGYEVRYGSDPLDPLDYPMMPQEWYDTLSELVDANSEIIQSLYDWSNGNATLLNNLISSVNSNATLLQKVAG